MTLRKDARTFLGVVALIVALAGFAFTLYLNGEQSASRTSELQKAFCGTPQNPGLLPSLASAPTSPHTTALGHRIIDDAAKASLVLHCKVP